MTKPNQRSVRPFRILDYPLFDMAKIVALIHANIVGRAPGDLTPSRWRVISHLGEQNALTINDLAKLAVLERSALSRVVDSLEREGVVRRRRNIADNRRVEVSLTAAGCRLYGACATIAKDEIERALNALNDVELQKLKEYLARVRANVAGDDEQAWRGDSAAE
jgi:DNA-binding MarR family transcriptional regulator